ncbi:MAG: S8 family serine peptidase [Planctomycetota bacterium]|nr:S8 family serine peptidase [Planctomycetota bacterium]
MTRYRNRKSVCLSPMIERLELRQLLAADLPWNSSSTIQAEGEDSPIFYMAGQDFIQLRVHPTKVAVGFKNESVASLLNNALLYSRGVTPGVQVYESSNIIDASVLSQIKALESVSYTTPVLIADKTNTEMVLLDEVVVSLKPNVTIQQVLADRPQFVSYSAMFGVDNQFVLKVGNSVGLQTLHEANRLLADPRLEWVEPNFYQNWQKFYQPNDSLITSQWHLNNSGQGGGLIDADSDLFEAWDMNPGGSSNIVVAVIDDGVQASHPDINAWTNPGEIAGDGVDNDANGFIDDVFGWNFVTNTNQAQPTGTGFGTDSHGTAVAGVATARGDNGLGVAGAAYKSRAISIRMFDGNGVASVAGIGNALRYGGRYGDIVNNSWGGGAPSNLISDAINWGITNGRGGLGATYFFSAGNGGVGSLSYPASLTLSIPGLISVGSTNNRGQRSDYSQYGVGLDIVAPSDDWRNNTYQAIVTTDRTGTNNGYAANSDYTGTLTIQFSGGTGFGGTSSASPLASGIAALTLSQAANLNVPLSPIQLKSYFRTTTDLAGGVVYDLVTGINNEFGYGRINAATAVAGIDKAEISVVNATTEFSSGSNINFGALIVGQTAERTFRIRNQGTRNLNLSGLVVPAPFTIVSAFGDNQLSLGEMTSITIGYAPTEGGTFNAASQIQSNDIDEGTFVLNLAGTATLADAAGTFYEDFANDGVRGPHDTAVDATGFAYVDTNLNGSFNAGEPQSTIDAAGRFYFLSLPNGTHTIRSSLAGWTARTPATNGHTVTLVDDTSNFQTLDFGFQKNTRAYARVYNDLNINGTRESDEPGVANLLVFNDLNSNQVRDSATPFTATQSTPTTVADLAVSTSSLTVNASNTIADVNVTVRIPHTWMSDMTVTLISPSNTRVTLAAGNGGSADGFLGTTFDDESALAIGSGAFPFAGSFRPITLLSAFDGQNSGGVWRLEVEDDAGGDSGTIENWTLTITPLESADQANGDGFVGVDIPSGASSLQLQLFGAYDYVNPINGTRTVASTGTPSVGTEFGVLFGNFAPTALNLTGSSIMENRPANTTIGTLATIDPNRNDAFTYQLVPGALDNDSFNLLGSTLRSTAPFDFETKSAYNVRIRTTDLGGLFIERNFVISVTNENEAPGAILLSNTTLAENGIPPVLVGLLSTADPDAGDAASFSFIAGAGSGDNSLFRITGNRLESSVSLNFETRNSYSVRVQAKDQQGLSVEAAFVISVTNVNEPPTSITLSANTILENQPAGTRVGLLNSVDQDLGETFVYTLVPGSGSAENSLFTIFGNELRTASPLDFETTKLLSVRVRTTDANGLFFEQPFFTSTINLNEPPTSLSLSANSIEEFRPIGTSIGSFATVDPDVGDRFTYALVGNDAYPDNTSFLVVGNEIRNARVFDFEVKSQYVVQVRTSDLGGLSRNQTFTIRVSDVNDPPSDIGLSANIVPENAASGITVGKLSTVDPDIGDTFTYALVSGTGSTDNSSFAIVGDELRTAQSFDFESKTSYSVRISSRDSTGIVIQKQFTIAVSNINEAPTALALSSATLLENMPANAVVGTLATSDPDNGDTFVYSFGTGAGDSDNASFAIVGNVLQAKSSLDFESKSSYAIRIRTTDSGSLALERTFTISVMDVNEAPTQLNVNADLRENLPSSTVIATFSTNDPDLAETTTYQLVTGTGDTDNGSFSLGTNGQLRINSTANFEVRNSYSIRVRAVDKGGLTVERDVLLSVVNGNDIPTNITLTPQTMLENAPFGTTVGTFNTIDEDSGDSFTYSLVNGSGSNDNTSFVIVSNTLRASIVPDFETKSSYNVRIRTTDAGGASVEVPLTISIINANEPPTDIRLSPSSIAENLPANTVVGTLASLDQDASESFTYQLVSGTGSDGNGWFRITGTELVTSQILNFEQSASPSIRVRSTDSGGNTLEKTINITVLDTNDLPTPPSLSNRSIVENQSVGTVVGLLSSFDEDSNDATVFQFVGSGNDNAQFTISGNQLLSNAIFDFERKSTYTIELQAIDKSGTGPISSFTINIIDLNEAPSGIILSNATAAENNITPTLIGELSAVDADAADTAQFSFSSGLGSEDNGSFALVGRSLYLIEVADFEAKPSYSIRVKATDAAGLFFEFPFLIEITNQDESPFGLSISNNRISESPSTGRFVGTLSATEPDGQPIVYSLVVGAGNNSQFALMGSSVVLLPATDFETTEQYELVARASDPSGNFVERSLTIFVTDVEESPVDVNLTSTTVLENQSSGTLVGRFSSVDSDRSESFDYSLVEGSGAGSNSSFIIVGDELRTSRSLDFEAQQTLQVRVRTTDSTGLFFEKAFSLVVLNVNESPTLVSLSNFEVVENAVAPVLIGTLSHNDPDALDSVSFSLVTGPGDADNSRFTISDNTLRLLESPNFERKSRYEIRIRAQDFAGLFADTGFSIGVSDLNEAPFGLSLSNLRIDESALTNRFVGTISALDPDEDPLVYSLAPGIAENSNFFISGSSLFLSSSSDFETKPQYFPVLRATDPAGLSVDTGFTILINDVAEAPTSLTMSTRTVAENQASGTIVGVFSTSDQDVGSVFTYTLTPGAGSQNNSLFSISGNELRTTAKFNFEMENNYSIRVRTTDSTGLSLESVFRIDVTDLPEQFILAGADFANTPKDLRVVISVLANDVDPDGFVDATTVAIVTPPTQGQVNVRPDGTMEYTPLPKKIYSESFAYRVKDNDGEWSNVANVTVSVESAFHNHQRPLDVNADGRIDSLDVLVLVNEINTGGQRDLPSELPYTTPYLDPNNDGALSSLDVLLVVNFLNSDSSLPEPEGEVFRQEISPVGPFELGSALAVDVVAIDDFFRDYDVKEASRRQRRFR